MRGIAVLALRNGGSDAAAEVLPIATRSHLLLEQMLPKGGGDRHSARAFAALGSYQSFLLVPGARHGDHVLAQVDVAPSKPAQLAAAKRREGGCPPYAALLVRQHLDQFSSLQG